MAGTVLPTALQLLSHPDGDALNVVLLMEYGVPAGDTGSFDELPVGTLQFSGVVS